MCIIRCNLKKTSLLKGFKRGCWNSTPEFITRLQVHHSPSGCNTAQLRDWQFCTISIKCTTPLRDKRKMEKGKIVFSVLHELCSLTPLAAFILFLLIFRGDDEWKPQCDQRQRHRIWRKLYHYTPVVSQRWICVISISLIVWKIQNKDSGINNMCTVYSWHLGTDNVPCKHKYKVSTEEIVDGQ